MAEGDDGEKTEEPTQKKLDDAFKKGDIAKSQEVNLFFGLLAATLGVSAMSTGMSSDVMMMLRRYIAMPHDILVDEASILILTKQIFMGAGAVLFLPLLLFMVAGVAGNLVQHKPLMTTEKIKPKLNKISLFAGAKRLFSGQSVANFLKGLFKLVVVTSLIIWAVLPDKEMLNQLMTADLNQLLYIILDMVIKVFIVALVAMAPIALADYLYQKATWMKKQRMSIKEIKDEYKQMEGDPLIKGKIRQLRMERARGRMMAEVPNAAVVITNPTHYAVALKYDEGMPVPICVAKGVDAVALRIREVAKDNNVTIVENPPLARALYASIELEEEVPGEHFKAVAQVIGYVMRLKGKMQ
ncbi:MAG: flagellar biosynthesis protein FlhB [OCS116 cluster bacterium]|uniref:Flagellar biosynthetic protein FlhB n=1 Tax=OCS116 cluster bacterium TaxID=2030921 RepID=A0A2A4Z1X8_9PROT|nr:flagellar biosynthesis protein FlhB [OCS116 cluster bacterium]